jgi:hypothetical protein
MAGTEAFTGCDVQPTQEVGHSSSTTGHDWSHAYVLNHPHGEGVSRDVSHLPISVLGGPLNMPTSCLRHE